MLVIVSKLLTRYIRSDVVLLLISFFLLKIYLGFLLNYFGLIPSNYNSDAIRYHEMALSIRDNFVNQNIGLNSIALSYYSFYPILVSIMYLFFGPQMYVGVFFNIFISQLTVINIFKIVKIKIGSHTAKKTLLLLSVLPSLTFFSFTLIREILIIYLISLLFLKYESKKKKVGIFSILLIIFLLRPYLAILIIALFLISIFLTQQKTRFDEKVVSINRVIFIMVVGVPFMLIYGAPVFSILLRYTPLSGLSGVSFYELLQLTRNAMTGTVINIQASSAYGVQWVIHDFVSFGIILTKGLFNFIFGPTIFSAHNNASRVIAIETLLYLLLTIRFIFNYKEYKFIIKKYTIGITAFGIILFYSLITTDYGTAIRFKLQSLPWLLPLLVINSKKL
jgi:hypothetical protein